MHAKSHIWYDDLRAAVANLSQLASKETLTEIEQDAFVKRFELAYELCWKCLQMHLQQEGIVAKSPRQVFKEAIALELIDDERIWLEMIEVRNTLVHTYNAVKARALVYDIRARLVDPIRLLAERLRQS